MSAKHVAFNSLLVWCTGWLIRWCFLLWCSVEARFELKTTTRRVESREMLATPPIGMSPEIRELHVTVVQAQRLLQCKIHKPYTRHQVSSTKAQHSTRGISTIATPPRSTGSIFHMLWSKWHTISIPLQMRGMTKKKEERDRSFVWQPFISVQMPDSTRKNSGCHVWPNRAPIRDPSITAHNTIHLHGDS